MTILLRLENKIELTVCGMISQPWLDGLRNGEIARAQGGLTQGQLAWRDTRRQIKEQGSGPVADDTRPMQRTTTRRRPQRARTTSPTPDRFDLVDTEEL